ncbi:MAG: Lrp/AsnC family transcriptional regulator, partial [Undibacterium sp.]|nr:Lrp/AsnC family transcriptional regulator [Undibacterium sp.]
MLDKIDREIIALLQADARLSYRDLGEYVFLSANTVADRVRRLLNENVLQGFHASVNLEALGCRVHALIDVKLKSDTSADYFESAISAMPGVLEASLLTGSYDYLLKVACAEHADLVHLIENLRATAGAQETHSRVILRTISCSQKEPLVGRKSDTS